MNNSVQISVIKNNDGFLCKEISVDQKISHANIYDGTVLTASVNPSVFADGLKQLGHDTALIMGTIIPGLPNRIVCDKDVDFELSISRSKKYFSFPDECLLFFDFDYAKCEAYQDLNMYSLFDFPKIESTQDAFNVITDIYPELKSAPFVIKPSSSSKIWNNTTNTWHVDNRGFHGFCWVKNSFYIKQAVDNIFHMLFIKYGWLFITKNGSVLKRCPIDISVISPEKLCFAAPPICRSPLISKACDYIQIYNPDAELFDLTKIINQDPENKRFNRKDNDLRKMDIVQETISRTKNNYIKNVATSYAIKNKKDVDESKKIINMALDTKLLPNDYILPVNGGITVLEVYKDLESHNGIYIKDPVEPDYDGGRKVAYLFFDDNNQEFKIYSHAHGGNWYKLMQQDSTIKISNLSEYDLKELIKTRLSKDQNLYHKKISNQELLLHFMKNNQLYSLDNPISLKNYLYSKIKFTSTTKNKGTVVANCPENSVKLLFHEKNEPYTREIKDLIDYPIYDLEFNRSTIGYNKNTKIYVIDNYKFNIPDDPSKDDIVKHFNTMFYPFSLYNFDSGVSKSCLVAGVFGSIFRPVLSNQPGLLVNSPVQGVGKGKIVSALRQLVKDTSSSCGFNTCVKELEKNISSILNYSIKILGIDNVEDSISFGNNIISSIITETDFLIRLFSTNIMVNTGLLNLMVVLTGNNITLTNDSMRRFLNCKIVSNSPDPYNSIFPFNPPDYCRDNRYSIIESVLTLIQAYKVNTNCGKDFTLNSASGSFDHWNSLVRKPICWLATEFPAFNIMDPWASIQTNSINSIENEVISQFLLCLKEKYFKENDPSSFFAPYHNIDNRTNIKGTEIADYYLKCNSKDIYGNVYENSDLVKAIADLLVLKKKDLKNLSSLVIAQTIASIKDKVVKINDRNWCLRQTKYHNSSVYHIEIHD